MIARLEQLIGKTATKVWLYIVALGLCIWAAHQIGEAIGELIR